MGIDQTDPPGMPPEDPPQGAATPTWDPALTPPQETAGALHPCVVLAGLDTPIPQPLHGALHEANLAARIEHDPRLAMAELCLLRRTARQQAAEGNTGAAPAPLVLLAPPAGPSADMIAALCHMLPDVPVLMLQGSALTEYPPSSMPSPEVDPDEILSLLGRPGTIEQEPV